MQIIKNEKEDLERLVNKLNYNLVLNKIQKIFLGILIFGGIFQAKAQQNPAFGDGTKYILANVDVTGTVSYNQQTVITFAGLQKGQTLTVPGEEISSAIKKLGKLGLFSEIDFYVSKVEGDSIFYDRTKEFASATRNVKITDTVNKGIVKGHYGEVYKLKDS